jgi:hypothetical protein
MSLTSFGWALHVRLMTRRLRSCLPNWLSRWIEGNAQDPGRPQCNPVVEALKRVALVEPSKPYLLLAVSMNGCRTLSRREGFSRVPSSSSASGW